MDYYVITKNGAFVALTTENPVNWNLEDVSVHQFIGVSVPDLNTHVWNETTDNFTRSLSVYTKLEFMNQFSIEERIGIRNSTDPVVADFMQLLNVAEYIDTQNPNTIAGINYLKQVGLLTADRALEILT